MSRRRLLTIGLLPGAALLLSACGQTGPLYLPERGEVVTRPAPSAVPDTTPPSAPTPPSTSTPPPTAPPKR